MLSLRDIIWTRDVVFKTEKIIPNEADVDIQRRILEKRDLSPDGDEESFKSMSGEKGSNKKE